MARRDLRILLALCALSLVWLVTQSVTGMGEGLALLAPALLLAVPLLLGRYVGEDALERIRAARRTVHRRVRAVFVARPRGPRATRLRGALLGARGAERAPPAGRSLLTP